MKLTPEQQQHVAAMPAALRKLLEAELAAGNEIVEVSQCFPAPPAGAYFKLAKPVSTRPRKSSRWFTFYARNNSSYSGEFTDKDRFYFILEPALPPEPPPDMNQIRAALEAKQRASDAALYARQKRTPSRRTKTRLDATPSTVAPQAIPTASIPAAPASTYQRFRDSMVMNYERWHDGIGYDLGLLKKATPEELVEIENLLVSRGVNDWRDVEALAALDSPRARVLLLKTLRTGTKELAIAVTDHAPDLVSESERTTTLIAALETCDFYAGLTQTLSQVEDFHPPVIVDALFRGIMNRTGSHAVHFAAMLMFIHGKAPTAFDWEQRPFFLKFNTDNLTERATHFRELCQHCKVDPALYLT